jgi:hypothetical protein
MAGGGWIGVWGGVLAFLDCLEENAGAAEGERRKDVLLSVFVEVVFLRKRTSFGAESRGGARFASSLRNFSRSRRISTSKRHSTAFFISSRA